MALEGERLEGLEGLLGAVRAAQGRGQSKAALLSLAHAVAGVKDADAEGALRRARVHDCARVLAAQLESSQGEGGDPFLHTLTLSILANLAYLGLDVEIRRAGCLPYILQAIRSDRSKTVHYAVAAVQNVRALARRAG
jgi:hypothetical protein